jgi:hypothetical protein
LAFIDDRKAKLVRDQREKQARDARTAATEVARRQPATRNSEDLDDDALESMPGSARLMPGTGHRLTDSASGQADDPPAYGDQ